MTAPHDMDLPEFLDEALTQASPDLLRQMLKTFAEALMSADADSVCGADYATRSQDRVNRRNGYRERRWDTRAGTVELEVPRLREGSYFPDWLLERRKRAETAMITVVATCYLKGVSTRRMDKLVKSLGITGLSKSQVSRMAEDLDGQVEAFRTRPLDAGPYTFLAADGLEMKVREDNRVVGVAVMIATGVNADGYREVLGLHLSTSESHAGWLALFRDMTARGLNGVQLVTSDAHDGIETSHRRDPARSSVAAVPHPLLQQPAPALLQNHLGLGESTDAVVYDQPDADAVRAQFDRVVATLGEKLPDLADYIDEAKEDILAFTSFPKGVWRQVWSNNPQERLNNEIRRRTNLIGIFPNRSATTRLVDAVLAEQHHERAEMRRYMGPELLPKSRLRALNPNPRPRNPTPRRNLTTPALTA